MIYDFANIALYLRNDQQEKMSEDGAENLHYKTRKVLNMYSILTFNRNNNLQRLFEVHVYRSESESKRKCKKNCSPLAELQLKSQMKNK